jgi:hypothetical protein
MHDMRYNGHVALVTILHSPARHALTALHTPLLIRIRFVRGELHRLPLLQVSSIHNLIPLRGEIDYEHYRYPPLNPSFLDEAAEHNHYGYDHGMMVMVAIPQLLADSTV